jgi:hypothetical protein
MDFSAPTQALVVMTPLRKTALACRRCLALARTGALRMEVVQPLAAAPWAPFARDGSGPCCADCAAADTLMRLFGLSFLAARIATGNERQEQYRLPSVPMGLVKAGLVRPSAHGDFETHLAWLDENEWFGGDLSAD